ncbi:DsrE/DsrF/TusD sulfur relay family protein [Comamonas sp. NLF-1-9]|uniref:DsrE/DsrF/TusD sulfur relay family protein n=1 Tax=Comamonas sp. NLF-1-9 TaxID=2853163 RepID=UPI002101EF1E|nr:DsrE family protein [Comamonas sp. NLF-1-9]
MSEQKIVVIINSAPHGNEACLSGLRVAGALAARAEVVDLRVLLMSDATVAVLPHQQDNAGNMIEALVSELASAANASVHLCRTCAQARGLLELTHIEGVRIATLSDLSEWVVQADKVLTF